MHDTPPRQHILYYDLLTIAAAFAVVAMHVNSQYWNYRPAPSWILNVFIEKTCFWAVPVFFMITGATLMDYRDRYNTKIYAQKRIKKTVIPFLAWSIIGLFFSIYYTHSVSQHQSLTYYLNLILTTSIPEVNIYWFFLSLFAYYLCIPAISLIPQTARKKAFSFLIIYTISCNLLSNILPYINIQFSSYLSNPMCRGDFIYPLIGYILANTDINKKERIIFYATGFLSWVIMFAGALYNSFADGKLQHSYTYLQVFLACAVFVFVKELSSKHATFFKSKTKKIAFLSSCCYGIYLIHKFVLVITLNITKVNPNHWWWPLIGTPIIFTLTFLSVFICKHIFFIRKLI